MANSRECLRGHASLSVFKMNFGDIRGLSPVAKLRGCGASSCTKSASGTPTTWTTSGAAQLDQPPALTGGPAILEHLEQPRSARGHQGKEYVLTGDESFTVAEQVAILGLRTDTVRQLLGRRPRTFADWCRRNADAFAPSC
jgi:hypothetical protein